MAYEKKLPPDIRCPLEYGMEIFGGKWNSRVICVLANLGTLRYSQIRSEMGNVTDAVLASTLKGLIGHGMVSRQSFNEIPPRVEYSLTERGRSLVPLLQEICRWAGRVCRSEGKDEPMRCRSCDYTGRP
jgi:DNA-binding HxlR family transcriptional regulator